MLIRAFMETAANPDFKHSLYHEALFKHHILEVNEGPKLRLPPYYPQDIIEEIKSAKNKYLPISTMSSQSWYVFLANKYVLEEVPPGGDATQEKNKVKCKAEIVAPELDWDSIWHRARMKGITNENRSFLWRMFHNILPTQARLFVTARNVDNPNCVLCNANEPDDILSHSFINCEQSREAMEWLHNIVLTMDPLATLDKIVTLQFEPLNCDHMLDCIWITSLILEYIWMQRKRKAVIDLRDLVAVARAKCKMFCKSSFYSCSARRILPLL
jgi:hypothetical protein